MELIISKKMNKFKIINIFKLISVKAMEPIKFDLPHLKS